MNKIINLNNDVDFTKEPLFFGEGLGIQRYDKFKYEKYFSLFKKQIGFQWRPEEFAIGGKEKNDFKSLSAHEEFIFTSNLKYQTLLDSVQARGIPYIRQHMSNPELEIASIVWEYFEAIHSYSYTYIIKNVYPSPGVVFDNILNDDEIVKRATSVTKYYNQLIDNSSEESKTLIFVEKIKEYADKNPILRKIFDWAFDKKYENLQEQQKYNMKKTLYLTLISINILEGIRFYVSFACSYCFAQNKKMEGNAKIISSINRDENIHLAITQSLIKTLRTDPEEGFVEIAQDCEELVYQMYTDAAEEEKEWARYLFDPQKGKGMMGLNSDILIKYMEWLTNKRLRGIGLKYLFPGAENPISWIDIWTNSKNLQNAPQETEIEQYIVGAFKQDLEDHDFSKYEF
jgi:ribonucleoside-diphosphate reductase beta chain